MTSASRTSTVPIPSPTRRSILGSALLLGSVGMLSGCGLLESLKGADGGSQTLNLAMTPLTTDPKLIWAEPVLESTAVIAAAEGRPVALAAVLFSGSATSLRIITPDQPEGISVPEADGLLDVHADGRADQARLLIRLPEDEVTYSLLTSTDLQTWTSTPLSEAMPSTVGVYKNGIAALVQRGAEIGVREIAADGTVTVLAPITVPEGDQWSLEAIERRDSILLLAVIDQRGTALTVRSVDAGQSWAGPVELTSEGSRRHVNGILALDDGFLLCGDHVVDPAEVEGENTFEHPLAWFSADGAEFVEETISLDQASLSGEHWAEEDFIVGAPVPSAGEATALLPLTWLDSYAVAERGADGSWSIVQRQGRGDRELTGLAVSDEQAVVVSAEAMWVHRTLEPGVEEALTVRPPRSSQGTGARATSGGGGTVTWRETTADRGPDGYSLTRTRRTDWFTLEGELLAQVTELPFQSVPESFQRKLFTADDGLQFAFYEDALLRGDENPPVLGWIIRDGQWQAMEDLPFGRNIVVSSVRCLEGAYLVCGTTGYSRNASRQGTERGAAMRSEDGLTWEPLPALPEQTELFDILIDDGAVLAVGRRSPAADTATAAVLYRLDSDAWTGVEIAPSPSTTRTIRVLGERIIITGEQDERTVHWALGAEDAITEIYRSTDQESRSMLTDLGSGVQVAVGWESPDERSGRSVLWVSLDSGQTWQTQVVPGVEHRYDDLSLIRDGADLVVIVSLPNGPRGYRISDLVTQVTGEAAPSDG